LLSIFGGTETIQNKERTVRVAFVAISLLLANTAYAFDMGNMMNPSKWMGGNRDNDRYDDYRGGPGYGYGGYPGYGSTPTIVVPGGGSRIQKCSN
jgi:uncharacterized membrane protein